MRWHYVTGVVFGVFTLTWVFSGMLSMEPFGWATSPACRFRATRSPAARWSSSRFPAMDPATWDRLMDGRAIKEVEFVADPGRAVLRRPHRARADAPAARAAASALQRVRAPNRAAAARPGRHRSRCATEPFSVDSLVARLKAAVPDVPIVERAAAQEYDSYYYSRGRQTPLPILRVKFDDPDETWVYVDPEMSQVVARIHRLDRVERWLYNGLHSLDFSFWYNRRPLWDIGVLTLMIGGLASSAIGMYLGIRRLRRNARELVALPTAAAPAHTRSA